MVVANSTPLVYMAALSDFSLFRELFSSICIPQAVYEEVVLRGVGYPVRAEVLKAKDRWLAVTPVADLRLVEALAAAYKLDAGEAQAILLSQELNANLLLLDDRRAVRCARQLGLNLARTPMIYALAKKRGLVPSVSEKLDHLRRAGFWLKDRDYAAILQDVGE